MTMFQMPGVAECGRNGSPSRVESRWTCTSENDGTRRRPRPCDDVAGGGRRRVVRPDLGDAAVLHENVAGVAAPGPDIANRQCHQRVSSNMLVRGGQTGGSTPANPARDGARPCSMWASAKAPERSGLPE